MGDGRWEMRENLGVIIVLLSLLVLLVSVVALVWPLKSLKLGTRKRALLGIGASLLLFIVGGAIIPPAAPEQVAAREAQRAKEKAALDAIRAGEAKARADQAAAEFQRNKEAIALAAKGMWTQVTAQVGPCDEAGKHVATVAGRRNLNIYDLYPMVQQAQSICSDAGLNIGRIPVPAAIPSGDRAAFKEAIETCGNAYFAKGIAYDQMAKVLNGDMRPSAVNDAKQASEGAQAGTMLCAIGFMKAVGDTGLPLGDVMGKEFSDAPK